MVGTLEVLILRLVNLAMIETRLLVFVLVWFVLFVLLRNAQRNKRGHSKGGNTENDDIDAQHVVNSSNDGGNCHDDSGGIRHAPRENDSLIESQGSSLVIGYWLLGCARNTRGVPFTRAATIRSLAQSTVIAKSKSVSSVARHPRSP
jgi:hypothetical protein